MMIAPLLLALLATPAADRADSPVILDFTAPWCPPCQAMKPAVAQLTRKGYPVKEVDFDTSPLREKYNVRSIPTYVVVDANERELGRIAGYRPAKDIADLFNKVQDAGGEDAAAPERAEAEPDPSDPAEDASPAPKRPKPYETVVRIRIDRDASGHGMVEFGSGTIIYSSPEESIILTCAHIFKVEGSRNQYPPKRFPFKIEVHLSDGVLRQLSEADKDGSYRAGVHMVDRIRGEAIDYDFSKDVGLIRIRPGKRLPASPVVPADWTPRPGLKMTTVGCSEGRDATTWSTHITNPLIRGLADSPNYEAIECQHAPIQGRSGGGLYTRDGFLAGVCDFAEPNQGRGLYATPRTIHQFLDKNKLTACYAPDAGGKPGRQGSLVAQGRPPARRDRSNEADTLRAQGPDEPRAKRLTIPSPEDLKVPPLVADRDGDPSQGRRRKPTWTGGEPDAVASNDDGARIRKAGGARELIDEFEPTPVDIPMNAQIGRDPLEAPVKDEPAKATPIDPKKNARIWQPARPVTPRR